MNVGESSIIWTLSPHINDNNNSRQQIIEINFHFHTPYWFAENTEEELRQNRGYKVFLKSERYNCVAESTFKTG